MNDAIDQFKAAIQAAGLEPPDLIEPGKLHRFPTNGKAGDDAGWCKLFADLRGGVFGDHRSGLSGHWQAKTDRVMTQAEREAFKQQVEDSKRQVELEGRKRHEAAALKAVAILDAATRDPATHSYAVKKRVPLGSLVKRGPWPQRGWDDALLVPIYGADGRLWSIEAINADGDKDFLASGKTAGGFHPFGKIRGAGRVLIGEGVATVAACVAVEQSPAVAALCAGNLGAVAEAVRELAAPDADIIILADNDVKLDGSNPGVEAAMDAARMVGGRVAIPELDARKCDFWDVWNEHGIEAVRSAIEAARGEPASERPETALLPDDHITLEPLTEVEISAARLSPPCIVQDYLFADVATFAGPGGSGKTTIVLWESIHITIGISLYGLDVKTAGSVLIVTAEDRREYLAARVGRILTAMDLTPSQRVEALSKLFILDVATNGRRLCQLDKSGNIVTSDFADHLIAACHEKPPILIIIDPCISFGAGERMVNDNEQALIQAARKISNTLGCCVRFIHHTGKANAREGTLDQYSARGGSALPDGSRMVAVLQHVNEESKREFPPGLTQDNGTVMVLARAKGSYCEKQPDIFLKRNGFLFEHFIDVKITKEEKLATDANQVWQFLDSQLRDGIKHQKKSLEESRDIIDMTRERLRKALAKLFSTGRLEEKDLPEEEKQGAKKDYLNPIQCRRGPRRDTPEKNSEGVAISPSISMSPPYRKNIGGDIAPPDVSLVSSISPRPFGEIGEIDNGALPRNGASDPATAPSAVGAVDNFSLLPESLEGESSQNEPPSGRVYRI